MKILCLSNSFKEGGRCIAGIRIDDQNRVYKRYGSQNRPVWVRPVCDTIHEQIPNHLVSNFGYNDVIEFTPDPSYSRQDYQSENKMISNNNIRFIKKIKYKGIINRLCDNNVFPNIFSNTINSVSETEIGNLNYSLMFASITNFVVTSVQQQYRIQHRLRFHYNANRYNLHITDPAFITDYERNSTVLHGISKIYIVLSLGVKFNRNYYKLVTTILY